MIKGKKKDVVDNKNFRIENDKLYFKDKDTPIEELYFDGARKEGENMTGLHMS